MERKKMLLVLALLIATIIGSIGTFAYFELRQPAQQYAPAGNYGAVPQSQGNNGQNSNQGQGNYQQGNRHDNGDWHHERNHDYNDNCNYDYNGNNNGNNNNEGNGDYCSPCN